MASISDDTRVRHEHNWANRAVRDNADATDRGLWFSLRHTSRTHAHIRKTYIVWHLADGKAEILDVLRLADADLSVNYGMSVTFQRRDGTRAVFNSTPSRLTGLDVFIWVPAFATVRWCPEDWEQPGARRLLRLPLSFKQTRSLADGPVQGPHYLSELADFTRLNPEHEQINS